MSSLSLAKILARSALKKPSTRLYPAERRAPFKATRGQIGMKIETCVFCGVCGKKCPTRAIAVKRKEKAWEIDRLKCILCGACVEACPKDSLSMEGRHATAVAFKRAETFVQKSVPPPAAAEKK